MTSQQDTEQSNNNSGKVELRARLKSIIPELKSFGEVEKDEDGEDYLVLRLSDKTVDEIMEIISSKVNEAEHETIQKCIDLMKEIAMENFHYRLMCGEIRDPEGKIDVMQEFVRYQELEPERKKFSEYLEDRIRTLKEKK